MTPDPRFSVMRNDMGIFDKKNTPTEKRFRLFEGVERTKRKPKKPRKRSAVPLEQHEQEDVVRVLRAKGICFCAVPNGGRRDHRTAVALVKGGVEKGVPDLLIFDPPPHQRGGVGVALEMKRVNSRPSEVRKEQKEWLAKLEARGWVSIVGKGADDALKQLRGLGYEV